MLRSRYDAIVIGRGTAEADDPQLTCRLPGLEERSPIRIVIAGRGGIRPDLALFSPDSAVPTWVLATTGRPGGFHAEVKPDRVRWLRVPGNRGQVDLAAALHALGEAGLIRILESGGHGTVEQQTSQVIAEVESRSGGGLLDDATLVAFEVLARAESD